MSTTEEHIKAVKKMIFDNRRIAIIEVAGDVGILFVLCFINRTFTLNQFRNEKFSIFMQINIKII